MGFSMSPEQYNRRHEQVKQRAEQLWIEAGRPQGRDKEFWHRAERQIPPRQLVMVSAFPAVFMFLPDGY